MDAVDIFLSYVVGFSVVLFLILGSYEEETTKTRHKPESAKESGDKEEEKCEKELFFDEKMVNGICDETSFGNNIEDDWEGIERTELEKMFGEAVVFVNKNGDGIDADLKVELYGLQKLALEGPCHESQPMLFYLSARSKWNAWQKVGEMSRERAMEKYINTLVDAIPDWRA